MKLFIFSSDRASDVVGFTADPTGANLPAEFAPWTQAASAIEIGAGEESATRLGTFGPVVAAVQRDGFYLAKSEVIVRRSSPSQLH